MTDFEKKLAELGLNENSNDVYMSVDDELVIQEWNNDDECVEHIFTEQGEFIKSYRLF